jgi:hypothetical protein
VSPQLTGSSRCCCAIAAALLVWCSAPQRGGGDLTLEALLQVLAIAVNAVAIASDVCQKQV